MKPLNALTVDLEEWYQGLTSTNARPELWSALEPRAEQATTELLQLLGDAGVRATFFALGTLVEQYPDLVARIRDAGHEIALHGYAHRRVDRMTPAEFADELDRGLEALWQAARIRPIGHRAPYFSIRSDMDWAFRVLGTRRFRYDSSIFPARSLIYGDPAASRLPYYLSEFNIVEFPVTTLRAGGRNWPAAGGFYTRALPISLVRRALRQSLAAGAPAVLYLHPWELDKGQRYSQVSPRERVTHYWGRRFLADRLRLLVAEFRFGALEDVLGEWEG